MIEAISKITLYVNNQTDDPSIILTTKAIETIHSALKNRGVNVTDLNVFPYGKMFTFYDQDNNPYLLRED